MGEEMTFDELCAAVLITLPCATFSEDDEGQLIINTRLREDATHEIVPFEDYWWYTRRDSSPVD
jgi:hypothetical protein